MARYPIMLLTIVILAVAIAGTYFMKTRTTEDGTLDEQPQVENRWDEWGDPNNPEDPSNPEDPNFEVPEAAPQSFDQALQISQQTGKPVMLFFTSSRSTDWVPKMRETLADPKVAALLSNYVFYEVDCDKEQPRYRLRGWPTIAITDSAGAVRRYMVGYKGSLAFRMWLRDGGVERNEAPCPEHQTPPQMPQDQIQPEYQQPQDQIQPEYQIQPEHQQPQPEVDRRWRIFNRG